ncbi:Bro-N domain-containing protein [Citrobacter freundii]|nr:Bro-N domain-containing protein [Citrobacter freundii]QNM26127.1 Bro-N domain-containing protein [Citrobacter freundii]QNM31046.1 Bro-N domain-containing protein [Citrobacter freundii]QNM36277.1 Bro-N domain-containing protein [Citrobacter freundii]
MNSVTKEELNFHGISLQPVPDIDGIWLTANQIGYALQYADDKAVQRIFARHIDEFTEKMTRVVKLTTPGGHQETRVFSLRGAHMVAMFARTPVAKEFRRWVLDTLDREVSINIPVSKMLSDREIHAHNANAMFDYFEIMCEAWFNQIEPALRAIESPLAGRLHDRFNDGAAFMYMIKDYADRQLQQGERARIY